MKLNAETAQLNTPGGVNMMTVSDRKSNRSTTEKVKQEMLKPSAEEKQQQLVRFL